MYCSHSITHTHYEVISNTPCILCFLSMIFAWLIEISTLFRMFKNYLRIHFVALLQNQCKFISSKLAERLVIIWFVYISKAISASRKECINTLKKTFLYLEIQCQDEIMYRISKHCGLVFCRIFFAQVFLGFGKA